jgi:exonuclease SbcC
MERNLNILHLADLHFDYKSETIEKTKSSAKQILKHCRELNPHLVLIAGDFWERLQPFGNQSGVQHGQQFLAELSPLVGAIIIIKGNNEHDAPNSISMLHQYRPNIYAYEYNVALLFDLVSFSCIDLLRADHPQLKTNNGIIIHGLPYPTKAGILSEQKSIDMQNIDFLEQYSKILSLHGMISDKYPNIPKVAMFHGNVQGTRLSNGQNLKGQEIIFPPHILELVRADYYALGHIHLTQVIKWNMRYAGSWTNKNWGELEQKIFFQLRFRIKENSYILSPEDIETIPFLSSRPMIKVTAEFKEGKFIYENHLPENAEVNFEYIVNEGERDLVTKQAIEQLKNELPAGAKITGKTIPMKRESRSETIITAETKADELKEYARVTGEEVTESILEKLAEVEERVKQKINSGEFRATDGVKYRLRRLKLRGAIGIRKGIGESEIEIDFSQFTSGLIALFGKIGRGKTTIIENLHPYRTLVSKDGNLADHFELKDSYRIVDFDYGDKTYSAQIYIDGETKKQEAYLFEVTPERNKPLNDGKVSTYDKEIESIFGTETIFFNSNFSAQKSKGISGLKADKRRELFYEILLLNQYQFYAKEIKDSLNEAEGNLSKIENQIATLKDELNKYSTIAELKVSLVEYESSQEKTEKYILLRKSELESKQKEKALLEFEIDRLKKQIEQQKEITQRVESIDINIKQLYTEYETEKESIDKTKDEKISSLSITDTDALIKEKEEAESSKTKIENECDQKIETAEAEKEALSNQAKTLESKIADYSIYLNKADEIREKYHIHTTNKERLSVVNNEITQLTNNETSLQNEFKEKAFDIEAKYNVLKLEQENELKKQNLEHHKADHRKLLEQHTAHLQTLKVEVTTIDTVPCNEDLGSVCPFVKRAYDVKKSLPEVEELFQKKDFEFAQKTNQYEAEIQQNEVEIKSKKEMKESESQILMNEYSQKLGSVKARKDKLEIEQEYLETEVENNSSIETEIINLNEANQKYEIDRANLNNTINLLNEKDKLISSLKDSKIIQVRALSSKLQSIITQINSVNELNEEKKQNIINAYNTDIEKLKNKYAERKSSLLKEKEMLEAQTIDPTSYDEQLKKDIELNEAIEWQKQGIANLEAEQKLIEERIIHTKGILERVKEIQTTIEGYETSKQYAQRQVAEYAFLHRAFDKTGIPVLKLENSGHEITLLANELLSFFDSKFRIAIETTRLTKDGKNQKEVFEISVIDEDGITKLENKSGGEQVWIESAIQLAISMFLQKTGRKIDTVFLDEKDGSFDLESAYDYLKMIEQAHSKMNVHHTILITHRQELVELINNRISLNSGLEVFA